MDVLSRRNSIRQETSSPKGNGQIAGYLEKQGDVYKSWKKRWFALNEDKLFYFRTESDAPSKPINYIPLSEGTTLKRVEKIRSAKYNNCGLALVTATRTYLLLAESKAARDKWLLDLLTALPHLSKAATSSRPETFSPRASTSLPSDSSLLSSTIEPPTTYPATTPTATLTSTTTSTTNPALTSSARPGGITFVSNGPTDEKELMRTASRKSLNPFHMMGLMGKEKEQEKEREKDREKEREENEQEKEREREREREEAERRDLSHLRGKGATLMDSVAAKMYCKTDAQSLREELVKKDRELDEKDRRLRYAESALADMSEKYFVSVAVFAKMNATNQGYYCNIDVYELYAQAKRENIPTDDWPNWITRQIQMNGKRIRT